MPKYKSKNRLGTYLHRYLFQSSKRDMEHSANPNPGIGAQNTPPVRTRFYVSTSISSPSHSTTCDHFHQYNHFFQLSCPSPFDKPSTFNKMASQQPSQDPAAPVDVTQNPQQPTEEETGYAPLVDPRLPTRKDTSLREFLSKIDDYAPIVWFPHAPTPPSHHPLLSAFLALLDCQLLIQPLRSPKV